jgi:hypothetical protein
MEYLGNTIVSMMNTDDFMLVQIAEDIQSEFKKHLFSKKFYMLPKESFHMTIISVLNDSNREKAYWPDYLPAELSMYDADRWILEKVSSVKKPQNIQMILSKINPTRLELEPANEETAIALKNYRDTIATVTDTKRIHHDDYKFHLSIAYIFDSLTEQENKKLQNILDKLNEKYLDNRLLIQVPEPEFVIFNNMLSYFTDLEKRVK